MAIDPLASLQDLPLSYAEVGATGTGLPEGYDHFGRDEVIGRGRPAFEAASKCLMGWGMHRGAGLSVTASGDRAASGVNVLLTFSLGGLTIDAPGRVVHTIDDADRAGFTYGTLPGHPVRGEESFSVLLDGGDRDGYVRFVVIGFSRPGRWFTRVARPVGRLAQRMMLDRYQRAVQAAAET